MSGPPPIEIQFAVKNLNEVLKALKSIQDVIAKTERQSVSAARAKASEEQKIAQKAAREQAANVVRAERMAQAAMLAGLANRARQYKVESAAHQKELQTRLANQARHLLAQYNAEQAAARNRNAIRERSAAMAGAYAKKQADTELKIARQLEVERNKARLDIKRGVGAATKDPSKSAQARLQLLDTAKGKSAEEQQSVLEKARMLRQEAQVSREHRRQEITQEKAKQRELDREQKRANKERLAEEKRQAKALQEAAEAQAATNKRFNSATLGGIGNAVKGATGIASRVAQGVLNAGGGFSLEDSVQRELSFRGKASEIANKTQTGISQTRLQNTARAVAVEQGVDPEEILKGYEQVTKLNDAALPQALRIMPDMAKLATVTGTDMGDMGALAANITAAADQEGRTYKDEFGKTQKGISDKDLKRQLRVFTRQGIEGGVEVSDFARYGSRITAGAGLFTKRNANGEYDFNELERNEAKLGMAAQVARQKGGAATAAEATLAAQRFGTDLQKKAGALKEAGVDVADKDGNLRGMDDIIVDMLQKKSKVTEISDFKIGERGNRVLTGFADVYNTAESQKKGSGAQAVRDVFAKGQKDISEAEVNEKFRKRMAETDKQLNVAMTKLRMEVGTRLVPKLHELIKPLTAAIPVFVRLLDGLIGIADWASNNPFSAIGVALTAAIGKEVAAAGLQQVLQKALASSLGTGALSVASAVMTVAMARMVIEEMAKEEDKAQTDTSNAGIAALNARSLLKPGGIQSKEDLDKAKEVAAGLQGSIKERESVGVGGSTLQYGAALVGAGIRDSLTFGQAGALKEVSEDRKASVGRDQKELEDQKAQLEAFTKAIQMAEEAMKKMALAADQAADSGPANQGAASRTKPIPKRSGK